MGRVGGRWGKLVAEMGELAADSNGSSLLWYEMEYSGRDI
jgi:hypothetical protein